MEIVHLKGAKKCRNNGGFSFDGLTEIAKTMKEKQSEFFSPVSDIMLRVEKEKEFF